MPPAPLITELWVCVVECIEAYVVMGVRRSKFVPTSLSGEVREGLGIGPGGSWEGCGKVPGELWEGLGDVSEPSRPPGSFLEPSWKLSWGLSGP